MAAQHRPRRRRDRAAPPRISTASRAAPTGRPDRRETGADKTPMKRCEWCRRHGTAEHAAHQRLPGEEEHRLVPGRRCGRGSGGLGVPCRRALAAAPCSPPGRGRRSRPIFFHSTNNGYTMGFQNLQWGHFFVSGETALCKECICIIGQFLQWGHNGTPFCSATPEESRRGEGAGGRNASPQLRQDGTGTRGGFIAEPEWKRATMPTPTRKETEETPR